MDADKLRAMLVDVGDVRSVLIALHAMADGQALAARIFGAIQSADDLTRRLGAETQGTIREEFSSRMLAGLLAHGVDYDRGRRDVIADEAVEWADALIERLSKP